MKKVIATSLIAGILGMNFIPLSALAAQEIKQAEIIKEEKKLSKKEKKALEEKQNKINYVKGANIAGFIKVAEAMMAQGLV